MALTRPELEQFAEKERGHFEQLLKEFVEIPSVSADPDRKADLERCAELGLATVRGLRRPGRDPPRPRRPARRAGLVRVGQGSTDPDHLQPPRRRAGLEGDRALADGALHVHRARGHVPRPGHDRRQGAGALRRSSGPAPRSRRACRSTSRSSGSWRRRSVRLTSPTRSGRSASRGDRRGGGVGHGVGVARPAGPVRRVARTAADDLPSGDRRRPTSTRASRAAWRATRWPSSRSSSPRSSMPVPAA